MRRIELGELGTFSGNGITITGTVIERTEYAYTPLYNLVVLCEGLCYNVLINDRKFTVNIEAQEVRECK